MILSAHQPAYLPWLGYFHKIAISDVFIILDEVQFEKNSFINRNKIKTSNGSTWLSLPMDMTGHMSKTIKDMQITNKFNWREKHWKSIYLNYKKAPYFNLYSDFFEDTYKREWNTLTELTDYMTKYFIEEIRIGTQILRQSNVRTKYKKQELIVELCKEFKADTFVFGKMGQDYVDINYFRNNNINIYFQDYNHPEYPQLWGSFVSNLSIIDLLFNVGAIKAKEIILSGNIGKDDLKSILV